MIKLPEILLENDFVVVLNKPSGLLSIPDREGKEPSVKSMLIAKYGHIFTVHRLDKDTSGIILFAKTESAHKILSVAFEERQVQKYYEGIVSGTLYEKEKTINEPIMEHPAKNGSMVIHAKGKPSVTDYKVLEEFKRFSYLQFQIHTGRTHQIRVHMKNEGHPIICDPIYGDGTPILLSALKKKFKLSKNEEEERPIMNRLALHASRLVIELPELPAMDIKAELTKDMRALLQQLRKIAGNKGN